MTVDRLLRRTSRPESPGHGPVTRRLEALARAWTIYQPEHRPREGVTTVSEQPGAEARIERTMRIVGWALAPVASGESIR